MVATPSVQVSWSRTDGTRLLVDHALEAQRCPDCPHAFIQHVRPEGCFVCECENTVEFTDLTIGFELEEPDAIRPDHYKICGIEVVDIEREIARPGATAAEAFADHARMNVIEYLIRAHVKGGGTLDSYRENIQKAYTWLGWAVEALGKS